MRANITPDNPIVGICDKQISGIDTAIANAVANLHNVTLYINTIESRHHTFIKVWKMLACIKW
jgi:hypothetical protein